MVTVNKIGEMQFRLRDMQRQRVNVLLLRGRVVVRTPKNENFTLSFGRLRQKNCTKKPAVRAAHYFSSFNQSNHWFVPLSCTWSLSIWRRQCERQRYCNKAAASAPALARIHWEPRSWEPFPSLRLLWQRRALRFARRWAPEGLAWALLPRERKLSCQNKNKYAPCKTMCYTSHEYWQLKAPGEEPSCSSSRALRAALCSASTFFAHESPAGKHGSSGRTLRQTRRWKPEAIWHIWISVHNVILTTRFPQKQVDTLLEDALAVAAIQALADAFQDLTLSQPEGARVPLD